MDTTKMRGKSGGGCQRRLIYRTNYTPRSLRCRLIPFPPLAEQKRIVAKVDELMALCDQLEAQLATTQTDSRRLLEAVLHEALAAAA